MTAPSLTELNIQQQRAYALLQKGNYLEARVIFERLFEHGVVAAATYLGFLFAEKKNPEHDLEKAIRYYRVAAQANDTFAHYHLGVLLADQGNHREALKWYCEGSELGSGTCSFLAFREFSARGDLKAADEFFQRALDQGNPAAVQRRSIQKIKGEFGLFGIMSGLFEYVINIPRMARFLNENLSYPPS